MQEDEMPDPNEPITEVTPRRSFFGRVAAVSALGLFGIVPTARAQADGPDWPGTLKGRHRQVFDVYDINDGFPLGFTHKGLPYALGSAMWEKYKVGESFKILDPETKAPAVKNPWFHPTPGALQNEDIALDRLWARG